MKQSQHEHTKTKPTIAFSMFPSDEHSINLMVTTGYVHF